MVLVEVPSADQESLVLFVNPDHLQSPIKPENANYGPNLSQRDREIPLRAERHTSCSGLTEINLTNSFIKYHRYFHHYIIII